MVYLSIIVPMYNVEKYIDKCLTSIFEQDLPKDEYEIILLNDGSTDNTMTIAERYAREHTEIRLFQHSNMGLSATRNRGIKLAVGEYIYFMDSDDYLIPESLNCIYNSLFINDVPPPICSGLNTRIYPSLHKTTDICSRQCPKDNSIVEFTGYIDSSLFDPRQNQPSIIGFRNLAGSVGDKNFCDVIERNGKQVGTWKVYTGSEFIATHDHLDMVWWYFIKRDYLLNLGVTFAEGQTMEDAAFTAAVLLKAERILFSNIQVYYYVYNPHSITRTRDRHRHLPILEGKICSAIKIHELIQSSAMPYATRIRLIERQNGIVFDALLKIIRCCSFAEALKRVEHLSREGIYPIRGKIRGGEKGYIRLLGNLLNIKYFLAIVCQAYMLISKSKLLKLRDI